MSVGRELGQRELACAPPSGVWASPPSPPLHVLNKNAARFDRFKRSAKSYHYKQSVRKLQGGCMKMYKELICQGAKQGSRKYMGSELFVADRRAGHQATPGAVFG